MPQLTTEDVFKVPVLSIKDFAAKHKVKKEAIYYAIKHGSVDYIPLGREKFIVETDHTRQYTPNLHPSRREPAPKSRKRKTALK